MNILHLKIKKIPSCHYKECNFVWKKKTCSLGRQILCQMIEEKNLFTVRHKYFQ